MANRPTVVIGDSPGGSSRRTYATQSPDVSTMTVPRGWLPDEPDQ
jgi:hypothetical protein